jgi:hypothetical protein
MNGVVLDIGAKDFQKVLMSVVLVEKFNKLGFRVGV